ncbi:MULTISPECIES: STM0539 family protein [Rahnella]|uniref:STM0539 family protein n=1 Tax=Rahnella laticis TaxID=2787622 RepID=A0ABS0E1K8_9GAMM|nr:MULTISPECIES: STM0539 family protein [Rahnella]MBF7978997.1 STM0539 family protein [Rahnella laticis]MBF7999087.1 STM0539 family protein [Rahnella sp. LAC-M12]
MNKFLNIGLITLLMTGSTCVHADERSAVLLLSGGVASAGSSVVVSGLILSPILLPAALVIKSVEYSKGEKTATLLTETPERKTVKLKLSDKMAKDAKLKAGDRLTLEPAPQGEGAVLKKEGKAVAHMRNASDEGLSSSAQMAEKP